MMRRGLRPQRSWLWMMCRGLRLPLRIDAQRLAATMPSNRLHLHRYCPPIFPFPVDMWLPRTAFTSVGHRQARSLDARTARKKGRPMRQQQRATVGSHGRRPKNNDSVTFVCQAPGGGGFGTKKTAPGRCFSRRLVARRICAGVAALSGRRIPSQALRLAALKHTSGFSCGVARRRSRFRGTSRNHPCFVIRAKAEVGWGERSEAQQVPQASQELEVAGSLPTQG